MSRLILRASCALFVCAGAVFASPALAETNRPAPLVDESALRYYANHDQPERFRAELKRLQTLYPNWIAPTDFSDTAGDSEADLWALFAKDDLEALDREIEARKASTGYTPSDDLTAKLRLKHLRRQLIGASDRKAYGQVIEIASREPALGGCADLDVSWRVAEAKGRTTTVAAAIADYRTLIDRCASVEERRATLQIALAAFGHQVAVLLSEPAIAQERTGAFDAIAIDMTRAQIAAVLENDAPLPDEARLSRFVETSTASGNASDLILIGWLFRHRLDHADALEAFDLAARRAAETPDAPQKAPWRAESELGAILSLVSLERTEEAASRASQARTMSDRLEGLYVEIEATRFEGDPPPRRPDAEIADFAAATARQRSARGAEVLGWYAHGFKQMTTARQWFEQSLGYGESEGAARGLILAAAASGDLAGAKRLRGEWAERYAALADLSLNETQKPARVQSASRSDPLIAAFEAKRYARCVEIATAGGALSPERSLIHGWCLLELKRPSEALQAFGQALSGGPVVRRDAEYGRSLALLAAGDLRGAGAVADTRLMSDERRREIGLAILADQAIAAFDAKHYRAVLQILDERSRFAPDNRRLALLRGWSYWHLNRRSEAEAVFERSDRALSTRETREALAVVRQKGL
ncbi:hypothetical protein SAMN06297251_13129 [Fulvimarina manganoxydans]|uniref:Tetratricopeptide repeat-containing protein n=1 Tax=Fulvimarina manganoxydans TaxID=937218 RepID=A0A1W2ER73_9HYPH|nr:hypothetical protein [Fulvimarina manganoxydans]SMD12204.1 hypothetical protein SAMN06297251_13129 [Fulvimarina manganoxydans]